MDDWRNWALCILLEIPTNKFYNIETSNDRKYLNIICDECLCKIDCLDWALKNKEEGFWAGTDDRDRDKLRFKHFLQDSPLRFSRHNTQHEQQHPVYADLSSLLHSVDLTIHIPQVLSPVPVEHASSLSLTLEQLKHLSHEAPPYRHNQKNLASLLADVLGNSLSQQYRLPVRDRDNQSTLRLSIPLLFEE